MSEEGTVDLSQVDDATRQAIISEYEAKEVAGLKANRDALKAEKDALAEKFAPFQDLDPNEVKTALASVKKSEEERLRQAGEWEKLDAQRQEKHRAELEARDERIKKLEGREQSFIKNNAIASAMREARIAEHAVKLVDAYLQSQVAVVEVDGQLQARVGDQDVAAYLLDFVQTEEGKHYTLAPSNSGGGAGGGKGGAVSGENPWKPESFNLTKQMEIMKADPKRAAALKSQAGVQS